MTSYLVLKRFGESWNPVADVEAASTASAIRIALNGVEGDGDFVAVPARSWKPVQVSIERQVKVRLDRL